ncbi:DnaT-like ssDNA-binding protein [Marispirochaeta aestuarii]|uniref:DnaT-like ssDNA-binding protein n=1 Tax=Marispirochaeta aestuarii TaxID=1963862 RepID=UPI0029C69E2E|nr:DnaT-like ssDNA-binding protein [Marispirochaeta aestuarii]
MTEGSEAASSAYPAETGKIFIVEDGSGVPGATSYLSILQADEYHGPRLNSVWINAQPAEKEKALIEASRYLEEEFGHKWVGFRRSCYQGLGWPRYGARNGLGERIEGIPRGVLRAAAEAALGILRGKNFPWAETARFIQPYIEKY